MSSWLENNPVSSSLIGSGISNATNFGSALINYFTQKSINKTNKELAEMAYQQNVEQWGRENAYNHPSAQMARLAEAGLNPNLVYGNGSAVQTSARSPQMDYPYMQAPHLDFQLSNFLSDALNAKMKVMEIQNIEANTNKVNAETEGIEIQNAINGFIKVMREIDAAGYQDIWDLNKSVLEGKRDVLKGQKAELDASADERKERKEQIKRDNEFWDAHPELFGVKKILETIEPILPGVTSLVRFLIGNSERRGKKRGKVKTDAEGNPISWEFGYEE